MAVQNLVYLAKHVVVDLLAHDRVPLVLGVVQDKLSQELGVGHQLASRLLAQKFEVPEQGATRLRFKLNVAKVLLELQVWN